MSKKIYSRVSVLPFYHKGSFAYMVIGHYPDSDYELLFATDSEVNLIEEIRNLENEMCCDLAIDLRFVRGNE